jgi:hypothetical protein
LNNEDPTNGVDVDADRRLLLREFNVTLVLLLFMPSLRSVLDDSFAFLRVPLGM